MTEGDHCPVDQSRVVHADIMNGGVILRYRYLKGATDFYITFLNGLSAKKPESVTSTCSLLKNRECPTWTCWSSWAF